MGFARFIFRSHIDHVYQYDAPCDDAAYDRAAWSIHEFTSLNQVPASIHDQLFPHAPIHLMRWRLKWSKARVFVATDQGDLAAYGWIQCWKPFRSRYGQLFPEAVMMGPAWTAPQYRGRGLHSLLIKERLASLDDSLPIVSFCAEGNSQSEKGLIRCGFVLKQRVRVTTILSRVHFSKELWRSTET